MAARSNNYGCITAGSTNIGDTNLEGVIHCIDKAGDYVAVASLSVLISSWVHILPSISSYIEVGNSHVV